jgi:general stress protein 26
MSNKKDAVFQLMREEHLCVLSTLGPNGQPQSAVVGFSEDSDGKIVIGTSIKSRKYHNIKRDPKVSLVIGWDNRKTIQYEGLAHEVHGDEREAAQELHVAKHPENVKFKDLLDETYILIEPDWVRYTDASEEPWQVDEVDLT